MRCAEGDLATFWPDLGHCYWRHQDRRASWSDADVACRAGGGTLVTYNRAGERDAVRAGLRLGTGERFWIGFSRQGGGALRSITTGLVPSIMLTWAPGEPPAAGGDCVLDDVDAGLRVAGCGERQPFVCERPEWVIRPEDNHAYRFFPIALDWDAARAACARLDAHLVTIQDPGEQLYVYRYVYTSIWLGAHDRKVERRFQWITGERFELVAVRRRGWNDPDGTEDCLLFGDDNFWDDRRCDERHPYVCEKE
jgi:hypothetical protein